MALSRLCAGCGSTGAGGSGGALYVDGTTIKGNLTDVLNPARVDVDVLLGNIPAGTSVAGDKRVVWDTTLLLSKLVPDIVATPGGARFAVSGDSITAGGSDSTARSWVDSWPVNAVLSSGGRLQFLQNAGRGGYTSTQLLALLQTEVLSYNPDIVGIFWGYNDVLDGSNKPTVTAANDVTAVAQVRAIGAIPVMCTIAPQGNAALSAPSVPTLTAVSTGGTLAAATYRYVVTAVNVSGETTGSAVTSVVIGAGTTNSVIVDMVHMEGVTGYKVYREITVGSGTYGLIYTTPSNPPNKRFTDTGFTPGTTVPVSNTTAVAYNATTQRKIETINAWRRSYCSQQGIAMVDLHSLLVDPTTGLYKTGWTTDGTHPTATSYRRIGQAGWAAMSNLVQTTTPLYVNNNANPINLFSNGCLINGSATTPTGWASYGGASAGVTETLAAKTGFLGKAYTITRSVPEPRYIDGPSFTTGFSVGDTIMFTFMFQSEGTEAGGGQVTVAVRGTAGGIPANMGVTAADIGPSLWTTTFVVPAGATGFYPSISMSYGAGSISIGQLGFFNLTALGL